MHRAAANRAFERGEPKQRRPVLVGNEDVDSAVCDDDARHAVVRKTRENVGDRILGRSLCALGDFAVYPVQSYLRKFRSEFEAHVEQGGCPFGGKSSVEGIFAPSDQHAHHPTATVPS